jgi:hypothetical protein
MSNYEIKYIPHREIDKKSWDHCIDTADLNLIYPYSWYLDKMAAKWDGLIWEDYKVVMPLPFKSKFSVHYIYQPFLTAQLGLFGNNINPQIITSFINAIPRHFKLVEISLNSKNFPSKHAHLSTRNNYVLDINGSYESICEKYNENTRRNIKKCTDAGCKAIGVPVENLIELAVSQMKAYEKEAENNVTRFRKLFDHLQHNNNAVTYGVETSEGKLIAAAAFFIFHKRAYYILVGNHPESKATGASHFLIDSFIKEHAGKEIILDFEGSDIKSLAFFYAGFGAVNEKYPFLKINRLPFYMKWFKK